MTNDYSVGRYVAYGKGEDGPRVGFLEDGMLHSSNGTWLFRVDGNEVYGPRGDLVGYILDGVASSKTGQFLFRLEED